MELPADEPMYNRGSAFIPWPIYGTITQGRSIEDRVDGTIRVLGQVL
jgi:hypothetical protein